MDRIRYLTRPLFGASIWIFGSASSGASLAMARSLKHLVEIVEDLRERGIGFKVLAGADIDTTTPSGRLVFGIFASLAEFERELIRERVNAGLATARAEGRIGGRPRMTDARIIE